MGKHRLRGSQFPGASTPTPKKLGKPFDVVETSPC
ncbi:unnamed protein product [Timema podura]|uniref:Uncharacterized protein n=1 Tax=Timema podura TaxID=61482 RepID=A0ABN7PLJ8_TIMPD|nr:unnamed protein product [Timema podura]